VSKNLAQRDRLATVYNCLAVMIEGQLAYKVMKLRVQHQTGKIETLTLRGIWTVSEGDALDRLRSDSGFEHFFTKDGYYDGWGAGVGEASPRADQVLEALEEKRVIEK
jgi:hypothetical protein